MRAVIALFAILVFGQSVAFAEGPSIEELIADAQNGDSKAQKDVGIVLEIRGHLEESGAHVQGGVYGEQRSRPAPACQCLPARSWRSAKQHHCYGVVHRCGFHVR